MQESAKAKILMVDDEPELLAAMVRSLRSERFELATAGSGPEALEALRRNGPFAVIVSDLKMPGMDGVALLGMVRKAYPDTVRILFTGQPDMEHAIAAVNEGAIFRFIVKPCSRLMMAVTFRGAIEQYELITAQRVLLEQTLHGSIKALTDVLALVSPIAFGCATRLRNTARAVAAELGMANWWELEVAAMLSQIGSVTLPPEVLEKLRSHAPLSASEELMVTQMPETVEQILENIPRLESVREILHFQHKQFNGGGYPPGPVSGAAIPLGARILKAAADLDALEDEGTPVAAAFATLRERLSCYDPAILDALEKARKSAAASMIRELPLVGLRPGMILAENFRSNAGALLLARGQEVTLSLLERLRNLTNGFQVAKSIRVIVPERG